MDQSPIKSTNRAKLWLGLCLIFFAGAVCGVIGTGMYMRCKFRQRFEGGPLSSQNFMMRRLNYFLDLTPEQQSQIEPILKSTQEKFFKLRSEHQPEIKEIMDQGFAQIEPILTPEQREKLTAMREKMRKKWQSFGNPEGDRP